MKSDRPTIAEHVRAYRRRIADAGEQEVLVRLSNETVAVIDELKQRLGLPNRGQVLEQLFKQRRETAQQQAT
jgi:Ribbon-helix-helix protein, copG family